MDIDHRILRAARAALGWGQPEAALKAGVSTMTISRIERGDPTHRSSRGAYERALGRAGVKLTQKGMELP